VTHPLSRDVADLAKALKGSTPTLRRGLTQRLRRAGTRVQASARRNASWSSRIPDAIRIRTSSRGPRAGVFLRVDDGKAPHARPFEGISAGRTGRRFFRHPVFGRDEWVSTPTRPFLLPAVNEHRESTLADIETAIDDVATLAGFRRT
jgi:hypothetical protein